MNISNQTRDEEMELSTTDKMEDSTRNDENIAAYRLKNIWKGLQKDKIFRQKFIKTCMLCWSFVSLGLIAGQTGPSLLDLQAITQTTLSKISAIFTAHGVGYLIGTLVTSFIINRIHLDLISFVACFGAAITTAATPWCFYYELMIFVTLVKGVMNGLQDASANSFMLEMWESDCPTYMQALHFSFALGTIIAPLFTAPFLMPEIMEAHSNFTIGISDGNYSMDNFDLHSNNTTIFNPDPIYNKAVKSESNNMDISVLQEENNFLSHERSNFDVLNDTKFLLQNMSYQSDTSPTGNATLITKLYIPYSISAILYMTAAVLFLGSFIKSSKKKQIERKTNKENKKNQNLPRSIFIIVLLHILFFMLVFVSIEVTFVSFIATFSVKMLKWSKAKGSYITSVFSAAFTVGRFSGIFVVRCFTPSQMILMYSIVLTMAHAAFLVCVLVMLETGIWISTAIAGFATSVMFPGILSWAENDFLNIKGKIVCLILIFSCIGWMLVPMLTGNMMDNISPMYLSYIVLGACVLLLCIYISSTILSRKIKIYHQSPKEDKLIEQTSSVTK